MLLYKLDHQQKHSFLELVQMLSRLDRAVAPMEASIIREAAEELGIDTEPSAASIDIRTLPTIFTTRESRVIVMVELARLASSDTIICVDEKRVLDNIAQILGFSHEDLENIISLAQAHARLRHGIRRLAAF